MRQTFLILAAVLLQYICHAQFQHDYDPHPIRSNDYWAMHLNGKIKKMTLLDSNGINENDLKVYIFDSLKTEEMNVLYGKDTTKDDPRWNYTFYYTYDEKGKMAEKDERQYEDGFLKTGKTYYKYDDHGNLAEETVIADTMRDCNVYKHLLKYDAHHNIVSEVEYTTSDCFPQLEKQTIIDSCVRYVYEYDKKHKLREKRIRFLSKGDAWSNICEYHFYTYDDNGLVTQEKLYVDTGDGKQQYRGATIYEYNNVNEVVKESSDYDVFDFGHKRKYTSSAVYTYEYDDKGNWIGRNFHGTKILDNFDLLFADKRTIEYR